MGRRVPHALGIRANAETTDDAARAKVGAGDRALAAPKHMFLRAQGGAVRKMILR